MASNRKYDKICLFCRKDFIAQKRNTKYCSLSCASKSYKVNAKRNDYIEVNFEEYVKRGIKIQTDLLNQIYTSLAELLRQSKLTKQDYLSPLDYCSINNISRKTLSRLIESKSIKIKKLSERKILIKTNSL